MTSADEQLSECREVFCYFDSKGDERIGVAQVGDVLRALGQNPTEAEIQKCCSHWTDPEKKKTMKYLLYQLFYTTFLYTNKKVYLQYTQKKNRNNSWIFPETRITFEDFVPIYQSVNKCRENHTLEEFVEGLSHFDKELYAVLLQHLLTTLGERLSDEEVDQLLAGHDDSHGNIGRKDQSTSAGKLKEQ
ncbi:hypothetical protein X798_04522 [Onchocerca flexuosa]|uniref:EF-hand domain-containing protein n=1 Tax=Onchocerca flexuosa TaxID=387005 RepID=A0A238BSY8_9BILA|nr:hypothetical protein X798_04522 [Onchocerca flexuosa]